MRPEYIHPGDRVIDPLDNSIRTVDHVEEQCVFMADGGVMGADEIEHVYLESEDEQDGEQIQPPDSSRCPKCGSWEIEGGPVEIAANQAEQTCFCNDCNSEWVDVYVLSNRILQEE